MSNAQVNTGTNAFRRAMNAIRHFTRVNDTKIDITTEVLQVKGLEVNGNKLTSDVAISAAAGATNQTLVTFQAKDADGVNLAYPVNMDILLSDAATGAGLTATTASGTVAAGASGADLVAMVAKKALRVQTDAAGKYILAITDTAKTHFYPVASLPNGFTKVGTQILTASYG